MPSIHKGDLIRLAEAKAEDALLLLQNGRYANAYYLVGYAVELGLKAIIASAFREDTFPDKLFVSKIYVHKLEALVGLAGLQTELQSRRLGDPEFDYNWAIVANWTEEARYEAVDPERAADMLNAVLSEESGVLSWLKTHW